MKIRLLLLTVTLAVAGSVEAAPVRAYAPKGNENAVVVRVKPVENRSFTLEVHKTGEKEPVLIRVAYPERGWNAKGLLKDQHEDMDWDNYCYRLRKHLPMPRQTVYSNAIVEVKSPKNWFGFQYSLLPYFTPFVGLYRHQRVVESISKWLEDYPLYPARVFTFEFRYDKVYHRLEGYLDGNYAGHIRCDGLKRVVVNASDKAVVSGEGRAVAMTGGRRLPPIAHRAHPLLRQGASLRFTSKKMEERLF